ncbi:hypothetical protein GQ600_15925 [Phytophthora cactorum]|nr:hypothetical protein GQ600_15925 [Phytophthora cactorum]
MYDMYSFVRASIRRHPLAPIVSIKARSSAQTNVKISGILTLYNESDSRPALRCDDSSCAKMTCSRYIAPAAVGRSAGSTDTQARPSSTTELGLM